MIKQTILAVSREFGTGGHEIAEKIAEALNMKLYDREILGQISGKKNGNIDEEKQVQREFDFIREKAMSGESFVVVGRCAESVLRGNDNIISMFLLGDDSYRIERVSQNYGLSQSDAIAKIRRHDMSRKKYHNKYSKYNWGDSRGYDLTINVSKLGQEKSIETIINYIKLRTE